MDKYAKTIQYCTSEFRSVGTFCKHARIMPYFIFNDYIKVTMNDNYNKVNTETTALLRIQFSFIFLYSILTTLF